MTYVSFQRIFVSPYLLQILEWGELASVAENNYEHCVSEFYRLCDTDDNLQLTLKEWGNCFDKHISEC